MTQEEIHALHVIIRHGDALHRKLILALVAPPLVVIVDMGQSDDDGIEKDMPAWCNATGNEYIGQIKVNGEYRVYVRKK